MFDINDTSWMASGNCADSDDTDIWFPVDEDDPEFESISAIEAEAAETAAVRRCYGCPVQDQCLQYALELNLVDGVWGGLTPVQRNQLRLELDMIPHGTRTGYDEYGCRCEPCGLARKVNTEDRKNPIATLVAQAEKVAATA